MEVEVVEGYCKCWEDEVRVKISEILCYEFGTVIQRKVEPSS